MANTFVTGDIVQISGVLGDTAANGTFTITVIDATHFTLNSTKGNGAYAGGGTVTLGPKLDNLVVDVNGGSSGENNALVVAKNDGSALATNQFVVVNKGADGTSGTVRTYTAAVQWPDINYVNVQVVSANVSNAPAGDLNAGQPNLLVMGPDLYEPNDQQANATFLGSGATLQIQHASIFPNSAEFAGGVLTPLVPADQDFYRVVAQSTGTLDFQVYFQLYDPTLLPAGGNLALEVLDAAGDVIARTAIPAVFGTIGTTPTPASASRQCRARATGCTSSGPMPTARRNPWWSTATTPRSSTRRRPCPPTWNWPGA